MRSSFEEFGFPYPSFVQSFIFGESVLGQSACPMIA
jgi:hypothetical protein